VNGFNLMDKIPHVLWDTIITPGTLFSVPLGKGDSVWWAGPKSLADTNLDIPNEIPAGWHFTIKEMRAEAVPPTEPRDLIGVVLRFIIGSKVFVQTPADQIAAHWRLAEMPGLNFPWLEFGIPINPPLIVTNQKITVWADGRPGVALRVSLHGQLARPCQ